MSEKKFTSSFNGIINEIPSIYVDNFENPETDGARAYFLSHIHSDHTVGLWQYWTPGNIIKKLMSKNNVYIYTTVVTAKIIGHFSNHLIPYVKALDFGRHDITIPANDREPKQNLKVTLIPADHCIGSTMFLFETKSVKVLFTGDFRIRPDDLSNYEGFHDESGDVIKLDALYVDTTFQDVDYESFPTRSDSIQEALKLIRDYLKSQNQFVVLETYYDYGYEDFFNKINEELNVKVYVCDDKRFKLYSNKIPELVKGVTDDPDETRVFLNQVPNVRTSTPKPKYIKLFAKGWTQWTEGDSCVKYNGNEVCVCYATHCSRSELNGFVDYLKPNKVIGFPGAYYREYQTPKKNPNNKISIPSSSKTPTKRPHSADDSDEEDREKNGAVRQLSFNLLRCLPNLN